MTIPNRNTKMTTKPRRQTFALIRRFFVNTAGVAMIEFAFIAPLLVVMAFGTFEVARSILVHKRFQRATAMVGDLVAREEALGASPAESVAQLQGIIKAAEHAMWPYDKAPLKMAITQIRAAIGDAANTTVAWSFSHNGKAVQSCPSSKSMPSTGMIVAGGYAIMVEAEYQYTPILQNFAPITWSGKPFKDTVTNSPRNNCVEYGGIACTGACP